MPPRQASSKPTHIRARLNPWWRFRKQVIGRWLAASLNQVPQGRVLKTDLFDEASGPYHHASGPPAGLSFFAIDVDDVVARTAQERLSREGIRAGIIVADVNRLPFRDTSFSAVISLSTLDHFQSAETIQLSLLELSRVLHPRGRLAITLDNPANPEVWLRSAMPRRLVNRLRASNFRLGVTLSRRRGRAMLRLANFTISHETALVHPVRYLTIRLLGLLQRWFPAGTAAALRCLSWIERLERLPSRWVSGHYLAWSASLREEASNPSRSALVQGESDAADQDHGITQLDPASEGRGESGG